MIDPRDIPAAVVWHEGLLLAPQHFQETERRHRRLAALLAQAADPTAWGVADLVVDRRVLADGVLRVDRLAAVLPDGLVVVHPDIDAAAAPALELNLEAAFAEADVVAVHLAVAAGGGVEGGEARYRSCEGPPVVDAHVADNEVAVPRLVPVARLLTTTSPRLPPPARFVSLPLARLARRDDRIELLPYTPPSLVLRAGDPALAAAERIAAQLREQAVMWSERLARQGGDDEGQQVSWHTVRAMHAALPRLEALVGGDPPRPRELFLALADVVGQLAGLDGEPCPPALPAYDHRDALPAFTAASEIAARILDRVRAPYRGVPFREEDGVFRLPLEPAWLAGELVVGVRAAPGTAAEAAASWFRHAVVAPAAAREEIRARRTLGLERQAIARVEALDLEPPRDTTLFRLVDRDGVLAADAVLEVWLTQPPAGAARPRELLLYLPTSS